MIRDDALGLLYVWKTGDPLPALEPLAGFEVERLTVEPQNGTVEERATALIESIGLSADDVPTRLRTGHVLFVASLAGVPMACGWTATREAEVSELRAHLVMKAGQQYLWDFFTMAKYRGRGVYPWLLQFILRQESANASTFWIGHDRANEASGRGIVRAGFRLVADITLLGGRALVAQPVGRHIPEAADGARLFNLPLYIDR
jgi:hypothetical protein